MMNKLWILLCLGLWLAPLAQLQAQKAPVNRWVFIQSAQEYGESDKGFWDVPGYPKSMGASDVLNIQAWKKEVEPDRQFSFLRKRGNVYDIAAGHAKKSHLVKWKSSLKKNGVNIQIEPKRGDGSDEVYNRQEFTFKYLGAGRWKIYSDDGRVVCLKGRSSQNGANVHLWEDHSGPSTEWLFIDAHTNEVIYPEFEKDLSHIRFNDRGTQKEVRETVAEIDKTYKALYEVEKQVAKNVRDVIQSKKTMDKSASVVTDVDDLNNQLYTVKTALKPLTFIPYVGAVVKPIHFTVGQTSSAMETTNDKVAVIGEEVVSPTYERFSKTKEAVYGNETRLSHAMNVLKKLKRVYVKGAEAAHRAKDGTMDEFVSFTPGLQASLKNMQKAVANIEQDFTAIKSMNAAIAEREGTINDVYSTLREMAHALRATKSASKDVKDMMQKKHDFGVIKVSLEQVVNGEIPIPDAVQGEVDKWKNKMIGKITGALGVEIPSVPGVDKFQEEMYELKTTSAKISKNNDRLMARNKGLHRATEALRNPFLKSIACIPYKYLESEDLTEYNIK